MQQMLVLEMSNQFLQEVILERDHNQWNFLNEIYDYAVLLGTLGPMYPQHAKEFTLCLAGE